MGQFSMAPFIILLFLLLSSASANDVEDAKKDDPNLKIESSKEAGKEEEGKQDSDGKELKDDYDWKGHEEKNKEKEKTLEDELLKLLIESESSGKKGKGQTTVEIQHLSNKNESNGEKGYKWKEIVEKGNSGKDALNKTALLKNQKENLQRAEQSVTKKVEGKGEKKIDARENLTNSDAKKNARQIELEQKDKELEE